MAFFSRNGGSTIKLIGIRTGVNALPAICPVLNCDRRTIEQGSAHT